MMKRNIHALETEEFDLLVIGGGITGSCVAHDAALRGLKTALVEKNDFGMRTSAASSKLLHGGIRYLQKLQFGKVRESARERSCFQVIAPHITTNIPFIVPTVRGSLMKGRLALIVGMWLYRLICVGLNGRIADHAKKIPFGKWYGREKLVRLVSRLGTVDDVTGGYTLFETHMHNSERMTLAFIKTAVANDAVVANYAECTEFIIKNRKVSGAVCHDRINDRHFRIKAKIVVNAAGPFLPGLNRRINGLRLQRETTGFSKGVHLVTRQIEEKYALALSSGKKTEGLVTRGGRHIFIIPWRGKSLIGTTNVPYHGDLDAVGVTATDIQDFICDINALVPDVNLEESDIDYAFTGLYPLISDEIKADTYQGTGEYQVVDHADQDNISGMVSVLGAKYTTARTIAEQAVDLVASRLGGSSMPCKTAEYPLVGGDIDHLEDFIRDKQQQYRELLSPEVIKNLVISYGSEIDALVSFMERQDGSFTLLSKDRETITGEIAWAVEHEMACTLDDVIIARTGLGTIGHPGEDVVQKVSGIMKDMLGWTEEERLAQIDRLHERYQWR
ncbi:MAG: hypothetical protein CR981_01535 [Proteobacteria bacterium]|nr:MAG: hypothetical protein CR981_01535 [Pseudomonadota bacterium]